MSTKKQEFKSLLGLSGQVNATDTGLAGATDTGLAGATDTVSAVGAPSVLTGAASVKRTHCPMCGSTRNKS